MNNFYVYRYIRLDTDTPFYVGKGKNGRYKDIAQNRNKYFINIVTSIPYEVELIFGDLSEDEAFIKEIEFIKLYKAVGYCEANLTTGGEGVSGLTMSNEAKAKMRAAKLGKPNNHKGVVFTEEHKANLAKALTGKVFSEERKANISSAKKGKNLTEEHKAALSASHAGKSRPWKSRVVECIETGEIYQTVQEASLALNIAEQTLTKQIRCNGRNRKTGLTFRYLEKKNPSNN